MYVCMYVCMYVYMYACIYTYSGFHLIGHLLIGLLDCCYLVTTCVQGCDKVATIWKFN